MTTALKVQAGASLFVSGQFKDDLGDPITLSGRKVIAEIVTGKKVQRIEGSLVLSGVSGEFELELTATVTKAVAGSMVSTLRLSAPLNTDQEDVIALGVIPLEVQ